MQRKAKKFSRPKRQRQSLLQRLGKTTIGDLAAYVGEAAGPIRRFLNAEVKKFDASTGAVSLDTTGLVTPLTNIGQGDDWNNRDGLSVKALSLELRARFFVAAGGYQDLVRFVVFQDRECAGALPAITDVLETSSVLAPFNHLNVQRFIPIHDEVVPLVTTGANAAQVRVLKHAFKDDDPEGGSHIRYSAAAGAIGSAREGQLFVLTLATVAAGATASTQSIYSRVGYVDN